MKDGWYWYKTPWACGGIKIKAGIVVDTCPIYWKMIGWKSKSLKFERRWIGE